MTSAHCCYPRWPLQDCGQTAVAGAADTAAGSADTDADSADTAAAGAVPEVGVVQVYIPLGDRDLEAYFQVAAPTKDFYKHAAVAHVYFQVLDAGPVVAEHQLTF